MRPAPERTNFVCERGHRLWKYFTGQFVHRLLCPLCDADLVDKLDEEDA